MSNHLELDVVNEKQEYHNCEMIFSAFYSNESNNFSVDSNQKYKIYTTVEEVKLLNEALNLYQEEGFKETFLRYSNDVDAETKYPEFTERFNASQEIAKTLSGLAKDEHSVVQLSEYLVEQAPTFVDDFMINKKIESITINETTKNVEGYEDLKTYLVNS